MPTATESDDELLASREPGSFAVFYRRHVEELIAFFMRRTRNAELAADLTAETFAAALVARARFDPGRGSASAWLFGIALNKLARVERRAAAERRATRGWAAEHRGATVQRIAISGDRAAATFSNAAGLELETVQLRRTATGEWLIDRLGPIGAVGSSK
jgi:DNA-directed RNA polymerase specialized sigma24 family protein